MGKGCGWHGLRSSWRDALVCEDCRGRKNSDRKTCNAPRLSGCMFGKSIADRESQRGCSKRWRTSRGRQGTRGFIWTRPTTWSQRHGCMRGMALCDASGTMRIRRRRYSCARVCRTIFPGPQSWPMFLDIKTNGTHKFERVAALRYAGRESKVKTKPAIFKPVFKMEIRGGQWQLRGHLGEGQVVGSNQAQRAASDQALYKRLGAGTAIVGIGAAEQFVEQE